MTPGESARVFFLICLLTVMAAIASTVLLANDNRNLNSILVHFGLEPFVVERKPSHLKPYQTKTSRLPRPRVEVSGRLVQRGADITTHFVREIANDPQALCRALAAAGFVASKWTESSFEKTGWECASYREFPTDRSERRAPSSAFIVVKGSGAAAVSSFRIKLNIENPNTAPVVTEAAERAMTVFLAEVRWADAPDILENIRMFREFDFIRFGNRIQLKREFSSTPRYNLLITPNHRGNKTRFTPDFFDRERWLPFLEARSRAPLHPSWPWEETDLGANGEEAR